MRFVSAAVASLILSPALYLGAWGDRSLPLEWKLWANALALGGAVAGVPLCRLAEEELREGQAARARRTALRAADYAASTQQGISQIQAAYGVGKPPKWQADLLADMAQMQALIGQIEAMGAGPEAIGPAVATGEVLPTYALASLPSEAKHLLLCGDTGAGKSTLVKAVVAMFPGTRVRVYDIDATPTDWQGYEVIGRGDDFDAIAAAMAEDLAAFDDRAGMNTNAVTDIIIAEEYPALAEEIPAAKDWLKKLARRGRKRGFRVVLVSQDIQVDSLGLRNQSKVLTNFNKLFLGGYAFDKLQDVKDRQERGVIMAQLQQQQRPCLAEVNGRFFPCELPNLAGVAYPRRGETISERRNQISDTRNTLEALYNLDLSRLTPHPEMVSEAAADPQTGDADRAKRVREMRAAGLTQTQIIQIEWGLKPGDSQRYRDAVAEYKAIADSQG